MAKESKIETNKRRRRLVEQYAEKRKRLKAVTTDLSSPPEERFAARLKLAELPRNSAQVRVLNRCEVTGRPRGYYRKFEMCRICLRKYGLSGDIPGLTKSSW